MQGYFESGDEIITTGQKKNRNNTRGVMETKSLPDQYLYKYLYNRKDMGS